MVKIIYAWMKRRRKPRTRLKPRPPALTVKQILVWADQYHKSCGKWPKGKGGRIGGSLGENDGELARIKAALHLGPFQRRRYRRPGPRPGTVRRCHSLPASVAGIVEIDIADPFVLHRRQAVPPLRAASSE